MRGHHRRQSGERWVQPKQIQSKYRGRGSNKGQATVEMALVVVFLMLLLVGVADVARIYAGHLSVVQAAGVGARWATLNANQKACSAFQSPASVQSVTLAALNGAVRNATVVVLPAPSAEPPFVRVEVTYSHEFLFGIINNVPNSFTAGATRPGNFDTTVGVCNATPVIPPTHTPLPTFTPTRTSTPVPTATITRTPT